MLGRELVIPQSLCSEYAQSQVLEHLVQSITWQEKCQCFRLPWEAGPCNEAGLTAGPH